MIKFSSIYNLQLLAGYFCGKENTCGNKVNYKSFETGSDIAIKVGAKFKKPMETYPCIFCKGWHVGRLMQEDELTAIIQKHMDCEL